MTNLDTSNRVGGSIGNGGGGVLNGHEVTTLTSSSARSGHYSNHNNNNIIKETMINNADLNNSTVSSSLTSHRNNVNSIYNVENGGLSSTIPYNSSRRVPDVHTNMDTYDNSTEYKLLGTTPGGTLSENCHELKKWSDVSSVDKIASPSKMNGGRSDQETKINGLDNTKRRSNCNNDTNNNSNDNQLPR